MMQLLLLLRTKFEFNIQDEFGFERKNGLIKGRF